MTMKKRRPPPATVKVLAYKAELTSECMK